MPRRKSLWNRASLFALVLAASAPAGARAAVVELGQAQEALLTATVNGVSDETPHVVLTDGSGNIYALGEQLLSWRLNPNGLPSVLHDGSRFYLLNAIEGVTVRIDQSTQQLELVVPARMIEATRISYAKVEINDEVVAGTGAFLNYDVSAEATAGELRGGGVVEAGLFTPHGVGIAQFVGRVGGPDAGLVRLDTSWTIDDPQGMRSLRFGDSVSGGGPGGRPVRFGGIQLARKFALRPGFVTFPLPSIEGSAEVPSIVDVYVNDVLTRSSSIAPGPFDITEIPVVTGNGDVQLVIRDLLGRQRLVSQSYYASSNLLRRGLDDYSYEIGFLRRSYGARSNDYGQFLVSATHRYGFTNAFTGEAHLEATKDVQLAGIGASVAVPEVGAVDGSISTSRSAEGAGYSMSLTFERRSHGLSFGVHSELTSSDYRTVGEAPDRRPPASILHAFLGVPLGSGSLAFSYLHREGRTEPDADIVSANWSTRLGELGSVAFSARTNLGGPRNDAAELTLIVPLGFATSASAGARMDNGNAGFQASLQKSVPLGMGLGYRFNASTGQFERLEGRITMRTSFADYDAQLTWTDGKSGVRLSTAGSVGMLGGQAFASRKLDQSFARVEVGNYPGVRVYSDNQLIGRTGSDGSLIVPNLRPYDRNRLRIDSTDLPLDAQVTEDNKTVRPYDRTGVVVDFGVKASRSAFLKVVTADGNPLPAGSSIHVQGQSGEFVSAPGGEVYLTDVEGGTFATAEWAGGQCRFAIEPTDFQSAVPQSEVRCEVVR